jgi:ABC-2 type transport system permease protein
MLFKHLVESFSRPTFWTYSGWLDIVSKYRRSRLGIFWLLVPPIFYIWGLAAYFSTLQKLEVGAFAAHVGVGFLLFRVLMASINESTSVLPQQQAFILDGHTRLTDFVLLVVAKALFYFVLALPVLASALWAAPEVHLHGLLAAAVTVPILLLNAVWMGVVFSLLGARFPDVQELMGSLFIFGFVLTPIIWHGGTVPMGTVQSYLMHANPLYHLIEMVRAPILGDPLALSTYYYVAVLTVGGWALAAFVYRRYAKFVPLWL